MVVFEVFVDEGTDPARVLSAEVQAETGAVMMTAAEAEALGFGGLPPDASGRTRRFLAVREGDAPWIHRTLEASHAVTTFRRFDVDG